jgi:hypothetical protein
MTRKHKLALGALCSLAVLHELALYAMSDANVVARLLSGVHGSAWLVVASLAFLLLRLAALVLAPALLATLLFDALRSRIDYVRGRNRIGTP